MHIIFTNILHINGTAKCFRKHIQVNVYKKTRVPHKPHCHFKGNNLIYIKGYNISFHTPTIVDYEKCLRNLNWSLYIFY